MIDHLPVDAMLQIINFYFFFLAMYHIVLWLRLYNFLRVKIWLYSEVYNVLSTSFLGRSNTIGMRLVFVSWYVCVCFRTSGTLKKLMSQSKANLVKEIRQD